MTPSLRGQLTLWCKSSVFALCWFATAAAAIAQIAATGSVQGRVYNPASREYVGNAEVRLAGTERVVFTESDGTFSFPGVPVGPASITVTFSGYTPATESFTIGSMALPYAGAQQAGQRADFFIGQAGIGFADVDELAAAADRKSVVA